MNIKSLFVKVLLGLTLTSTIMSCGKESGDNKPVMTLKEATKRLAGKESKTWNSKLRETSAEPNIINGGYHISKLQVYLLPNEPLEFIRDYNNEHNIVRQEVAKLVHPFQGYDPIDNPYVIETLEGTWYWADRKKSQIGVNFTGDNNEQLFVLITVKRLKTKSAVLYYTIQNTKIIQDLEFKK